MEELEFNAAKLSERYLLCESFVAHFPKSKRVAEIVRLMKAKKKAVFTLDTTLPRQELRTKYGLQDDSQFVELNSQCTLNTLADGHIVRNGQWSFGNIELDGSFITFADSITMLKDTRMIYPK
jgi:hypothetical protein